MACVVETSHAARTVQLRLTGVANVALPENSHITIREALCDKVSASRIKSLQFDIGTNELVTSELDYQFCWEHDKDQPQLEHFTCTEDSSLLQKELPEPPKEIKVAVCENSAVGSCIAGSSGDPDNLSKTSETLHAPPEFEDATKCRLIDAPSPWTPKVYKAARKRIAVFEGEKRRKITHGESQELWDASRHEHVFLAPWSTFQTRYNFKRIFNLKDKRAWAIEDLNGKSDTDFKTRYISLEGHTKEKPLQASLVIESKHRPTIPNPNHTHPNDEARAKIDPFFDTRLTSNETKAFPLISACDGTFDTEEDVRADSEINAGEGSEYWIDADEELRAHISDYGLTEDIKPSVFTKDHFPAAYNVHKLADAEFHAELQRLGCASFVRPPTINMRRADVDKRLLIRDIYRLRERHEADGLTRYNHERVKDPHQGHWYDTRTEAGIAVRVEYIRMKALEADEGEEEL